MRKQQNIRIKTISYDQSVKKQFSITPSGSAMKSDKSQQKQQIQNINSLVGSEYFEQLGKRQNLSESGVKFVQQEKVENDLVQGQQLDGVIENTDRVVGASSESGFRITKSSYMNFRRNLEQFKEEQKAAIERKREKVLEDENMDPFELKQLRNEQLLLRIFGKSKKSQNKKLREEILGESEQRTGLKAEDEVELKMQAVHCENLNEEIKKELRELAEISKFHDLYFQQTEKNLFRTRDCDISKFWKDQFRESKKMYDFFEQKQQLQQKKDQFNYFSFKEIVKQFQKLWIEQVTNMVKMLDFASLQALKVTFHAGKDQKDLDYLKMNEIEQKKYKQELIDIAMEYLITHNVSMQHFQKKELKEATERVKNLLENIRRLNPKKRPQMGYASQATSNQKQNSQNPFLTNSQIANSSSRNNLFQQSQLVPQQSSHSQNQPFFQSSGNTPRNFLSVMNNENNQSQQTDLIQEDLILQEGKNDREMDLELIESTNQEKQEKFPRQDDPRTTNLRQDDPRTTKIGQNDSQTTTIGQNDPKTTTLRHDPKTKIQGQDEPKTTNIGQDESKTINIGQDDFKIKNIRKSQDDFKTNTIRQPQDGNRLSHEQISDISKIKLKNVQENSEKQQEQDYEQNQTDYKRTQIDGLDDIKLKNNFIQKQNSEQKEEQIKIHHQSSNLNKNFIPSDHNNNKKQLGIRLENVKFSQQQIQISSKEPQEKTMVNSRYSQVQPQIIQKQNKSQQKQEGFKKGFQRENDISVRSETSEEEKLDIYQEAPLDRKTQTSKHNFIDLLSQTKTSMAQLRQKNAEIPESEKIQFLLKTASITFLDRYLEKKNQSVSGNKLRKIILLAYQINEPDILNFKHTTDYCKDINEQFTAPRVEKILEENKDNDSPREMEKQLSEILENKQLKQIQQKSIKSVEGLSYVTNEKLKKEMIYAIKGTTLVRKRKKEITHLSQAQQTMDKCALVLKRWEKLNYNTFEYNKQELRNRISDMKSFKKNQNLSTQPVLSSDEKFQRLLTSNM